MEHSEFDLFSGVTLERFEERVLEDKWPSFPGLYAFENEAGETIYVGQSKGVRSRILAHRREKSWWPEVKKIHTFEMYGDVECRLIAETGLILRLRPLYNKTIKIGIANDGHLYELNFVRAG